MGMMPGKRIVTALMAVLICGAALLASPPARAQSRDCGSSVILNFGDTLYAVARRCGTTVDAIMAANPLIPNPNFIFPGLRIRLPEPPPPPPPPAQNVQRYIVQPGDTLYGIARANGTTLPEIYRLNPAIDARTLRVGDVVLLPGGGVRPPPQEEPTFRYRVRPGDTFRSIAREHDIRIRDIVRLNPGVRPRDLRIGDVLILPGDAAAPPSSPPATNTYRYVVRPGDTLYSIAQANNTTLREILDLNPDLNPWRLRIGEVIVLRGGIAPPPPQTLTTTTVSPSSGVPGDVVKVSASGFPPSTRLKLLAGSDAASLVEFQQVTSDRSGDATLDARIPRWATEKGTLVFAYETQDGRLRAVSDVFRVTATPQRPSNVTVVGTLTREGVECQAMRGDDGRLYTLAGDLPRRLRPGDRVRVVGEVAEISYCQQGTTISVTRISDAN